MVGRPPPFTEPKTGGSYPNDGQWIRLFDEPALTLMIEEVLDELEPEEIAIMPLGLLTTNWRRCMNL